MRDIVQFGKVFEQDGKLCIHEFNVQNIPEGESHFVGLLTAIIERLQVELEREKAKPTRYFEIPLRDGSSDQPE